MNRLLSNQIFVEYIIRLADLDDYINKWHDAFDKLYSTYSDDTINQAFDYFSKSIDYIHDESATLNPELIDAIKTIDAATDNQYDISFMIKIARFELEQVAQCILNQIYKNDSALGII